MDKLNLKEGTVSLWATVNKSPQATRFDFFDYKSSKGGVSLKIRNEKELIFTHEFEDQINTITHNYTPYFDKRTHIVVTWNLKEEELKLYLNGEKKKTVKMD